MSSAQARINHFVDEELFSRVKGTSKTMQTWTKKGGHAYVIVVANSDRPELVDAVAALMEEHK